MNNPLEEIFRRDNVSIDNEPINVNVGRANPMGTGGNIPPGNRPSQALGSAGDENKQTKVPSMDNLPRWEDGGLLL